MRLKAKATIRKKSDCNCEFAHPGEEFTTTAEYGAELIEKKLAVEVIEVKEEKQEFTTKEDKTATKTK